MPGSYYLASSGHVGIYIGDELFAHASSKKGVTISSLNHAYYKDRFMGSRRIKPGSTF
jgi:cell wall-associated NlpC family hydrolase